MKRTKTADFEKGEDFQSMERSSFDSKKNIKYQSVDTSDEDTISLSTNVKSKELKKLDSVANKSVIEILKAGAKKPSNWSKILIIALGAVGNAYLTGENKVATIILGAATCLFPIIIDIENHYNLIRSKIKLIPKDLSKRDRAIQIIKDVAVTASSLSLGLIVIAASILADVKYSKELMSQLILGIGTFISGSMQMYVVPHIIKRIATQEKNNLEKLGNEQFKTEIIKGLDFEKIKDDMSEKQQVTQDNLKALQTQFDQMQIKLKKQLDQFHTKFKEYEKDNVEHNSSMNENISQMRLAAMIRAEENESLNEEKLRLKELNKSKDNEINNLKDSEKTLKFEVKEKNDKIQELSKRIAKAEQDESKKTGISK